MSEQMFIVDDYTVVSASDKKALVDKVKELISEGWVPHGSLTHNVSSSYLQPMIKYPQILLDTYKKMLAELYDMQEDL